jgi:hypothetical protein
MEALRSTASKKAGLPRAGLSIKKTTNSMATRHLNLHIHMIVILISRRQWCESGSALFCRIRIGIYQGNDDEVGW